MRLPAAGRQLLKQAEPSLVRILLMALQTATHQQVMQGLCHCKLWRTR
jgi:hypothetical protein